MPIEPSSSTSPAPALTCATLTALLLASLAASACSPSGHGPPMDAGSDTFATWDGAYPSYPSYPSYPPEDAGPACGADAAVCNGACTDTQDDATHCGGCGVACATGALCAQGACVADVLTKLSFDVIDAEYSRALDRVIAVGAVPASLHVFDPGKKIDAVVTLPKAPTSVSVGPDGHHAAVGHDAFLSYVDLDTPRVLGTFAVSDAIQDVVLAGNGNAYAFPSSSEGSIHEVNLTTGTDTILSAGLYLQANAKLHPNQAWIYATDTGESPGSLLKYDVSDGGLTPIGQTFGASYDPCGQLWIAKDGLRLFTGCGYVFSSSSVSAQDMQYAGSLGTPQSRLASVDDTSSLVAALFSTGYGYGNTIGASDTLQTFDSQYLAPKTSRPMPRYAAGSISFATGGRFVFFRADGTTIVAIVQVDPASNAERPFAMATFASP